MFGETTISDLKIWNHPIETTIYKWLFGVPGEYITFNNCHLGDTFWLLRFTHLLRLNGFSRFFRMKMAAQLAAKTNNIIYLLGGFNSPWKTHSQIGSSPQVGVKIQKKRATKI